MYVQMISPHGLIRGNDIELGRDADTGGQTRYVVELLRALAEHPAVDRVDLVTRCIKDKRVSRDYAQPLEELGPGCRIVRLPCGDGRYLRKERLWPHLPEMVEGVIKYTRREGLVPAVVHGHYADGGFVAAGVAEALGAPLAFTGHSLGRRKLGYLLEQGWTPERADRDLAIKRRIEAEQDALDRAALVVTSTAHERDEQYASYRLRETLRFEVIPPGLDLSRFFPYYDYDLPGPDIDERFKQARVRMLHELSRFHLSDSKPLILAVCRPDHLKNIGALIDVYGQSRELQAIANLAVVAGIRGDIATMPESERSVLTEALLAVDRYDLYGKMAIPKQHGSEFDIPELYRLAASTRGVFALTSFVEMFGLTAIEASAVGLPFVGTKAGGPRDIVAACQSGLLVDVTRQEEIAAALLRLLTDSLFWETCSSNGVNRVRERYSWANHCNDYVEAVSSLHGGPTTALCSEDAAPTNAAATPMYALITDIDNTLLGNDEALPELLSVVQAAGSSLRFGVATGRSRELTQRALEAIGVDAIDVAITSVGVEIYYGPCFEPDIEWAELLRDGWRPDIIRRALAPLSFLSPQVGDGAQREFKVSYNLAAREDIRKTLARVRAALDDAGITYTLVFSHGSYVDVLPAAASKGKAVAHVARRWGLPLECVATAGDSGNDTDMLVGPTAGIVVENHDPELAALRLAQAERVYFAHGIAAAGILDGLRHYGLLAAAESR